MIEKIPFVKTPQQELVLLASSDFSAQRDYVLWYGFKSLQGQIVLAQSENRGLILLQDYLYHSWWHKDAKEVLYQRSILVRPDPQKEAFDCETAFKGWLTTAWLGDRSDEKIWGKKQDLWLGYGVKMKPIVSEEEQLDWFASGNSEKIYTYCGLWKGKAAVKFLLDGPEVAVFRYLHDRLLNEEQQCALIERDIRSGENSLIWYYFHTWRACPKAQKLIQKYDQALWRHVIMVNYGWDWQFEHKFGCLKNWQEKLDAEFPLLAHCPIEDIPQVLADIA